MTDERKFLDRRSFIRNSAAGVAGAFLLPLANGDVAAEEPRGKEAEKAPVCRTLGRTGIKLPVFNLGSRQDMGLYDTILEAGPAMVFTAQFYQGGNHEIEVGKALKKHKRDSYVLATAIGLGSEREGYMLEKDAAKLPSLFEKSLPRLQVDHVDVFFISFSKDRATIMNDDFLAGLEKLKREGKTRFVGIATHENEAEAVRASADAKVYDVALAQYNFKHPQHREIKKAYAYAKEAGLGTLVMKAHAGRFWDKENTRPINVKAALKWAAADPIVDSVLYRVDSVDEARAYIAGMGDLELTPQERRDLELGEEQGYNGLFCPQCGTCRSQCVRGLEIPTLMRGYMYAYGYRQPLFAKETIDGVDLKSVPCRECTDCSVRCTMGFDVREKVLDIVRLRDIPNEFLTV